MSDKANDILERQRQLASLIGKKKDARKAKEGKLQPTRAEIRKPQKPSTHQRPRLKRPTTSSILATAREKAGGGKQQGSNKREATETLKRKSLTSSTSKSSSARLANLVQNASKNASNNGSFDSLAKLYTPDDFWKNIREWDFVGDLKRQREEKPAEASEALTMKKPIPDNFINTRHYIACWAPKCLAEARAQILSEAASEYGNGNYRNSPPFVLVNVETTWKTNRRDRGVHTDLMDMDSCNVQLTTRERISDLQFYAHDICALIPVECKDVVETLLRGGSIKSAEDSFGKFAMIGHTESNRRELNMLILKVSKRKWALLGAKEMFVMKVGCNITALREFTALCKIDTLPLKKYLLGNHSEKATKPSSSINASNLSQENEKSALLNAMGGWQALGRGFTAFVERKFNPSQLMAISASSRGYGDGGFTLIKGPPGTGKTTTLVTVLNSLHIRQYNKYYEEVRRIASMQSGNRQSALDIARKAKPRLLVCAPSNAGVDNIILKIMEDGFVDGSGQRYNPSMIRIGARQSSNVRDVALQTKVDQILAETDPDILDRSISGFRMELQRISADITKCRRRVHAIVNGSPWPLSKDWEIRVDESSFDTTGRVFFVNHKTKRTSYEVPPPPEPGEKQFEARAMPEYRTFMSRTVKLVENYFSVKSNLELSTIVKGSLENGANQYTVRQNLETHVLNSVHLVMTTLGSAGNRVFEAADKFEVVVVDEAAQSVEPSTLAALQLGSRQAVLVGDPQQLPATIFNVSGRNSKYDRSLFQRLEEAGSQVYMLNEQYRMDPKVSHFPRMIFYGGNLLDGPNVKQRDYGYPLRLIVESKLPNFQPFTVLDLDSKEERGGTSLSNSTEAQLAVHVFSLLNFLTNFKELGRVAVITPYSQQAGLLRSMFSNLLGRDFSKFVEVNTVDAFQGREANVVIFSAVRAAGSRGIGFLSDVRRMNVALTRAKHFLFVIARCKSIVVNPYWNDLITHARETNAVLRVPILPGVAGDSFKKTSFGSPQDWKLEKPARTWGAQPHRITDFKQTEAKKPANPTDLCQTGPRKTISTDLRHAKLAMHTPTPTDPRKRRRFE